MLESSEPSHEVAEWLSTLHLSQYIPFFQQGGYRVLDNCKDLTDERLLELMVLPTGHRRRILRSLEALGLKQQSGDEGEDEEGPGKERKPKLYPRHVFMDRQRGTSYQHNQTKEKREYDSEGSQSLPAGAGLAGDEESLPNRQYPFPPKPAPRNLQSVQTLVQVQTCRPASTLSSSSSESLSAPEVSSDLEVSSEEHFSSAAEAPLLAVAEDKEGVPVQMVDNSIYDMQLSVKDPTNKPRHSRSYRLRHRPVPEIPNSTSVPLQERYF